MANLDLTAANPVLKEYYDDQKVQSLVYSENPTLALLPKDTQVQGKLIPLPTLYENGQGGSATFSTSQANQTAEALAEFQLVVKRDYATGTIDNLTLELSATNKGAFIRGSTLVIDGKMRLASGRTSSALFRSGTGSRGAISTIVSGVITLTNPEDVTQFGVNQTLQAAATDGATPRAALGYVIARSVKAGTITVSATAIGGAAGSPSLWQAGDFLLVQGDSNLLLPGFAGWLPTTDPTSTDNFNGVNRSADSRLYGMSYDGAAQPIEEALIDHSLLLSREDGSTDHCITNFGSYGSLIKALGSKKNYVSFKGPAGIGFEGVQIIGAKSAINVFPDRSCQAKRAYMLKLETWKLYSVGDAPKILRYGSNDEMLRVYNQDAAEVRIASYCTLGCNAPGANGTTILGA